MPAVWMLLPGLILLYRRFGRFLIFVSGILLLVGTTPIVGNLLLGVLERGAMTFDASAMPVEKFDAIVVPLAGAYKDPVGRWWPLPGSVDRTVRGQKLQEGTGIPLVVIGGAPLPDQTEPETFALQRVITLDADTIVEGAARDTFETARAVSDLFPALEGGCHPRRVIIVTGGFHVMRMAAALRRFGFDVVTAPPQRFEDVWVVRNFWLDLIPSARGAGRVRRALHEYIGISWYLVTGRIRLRDL